MKKSTDQIKEFQLEDLVILDHDKFIAINKPPGVPSQADRTGDTSILDYIQEKTGQDYHLINRLDRPVSGILIGVKKHALKAFSRYEMQKTYLALTNKPELKKATLVHYLQKDGRKFRAHIKEEETEGYQVAKLHYTVKHEMDNYDLLEVQLDTGRFHQIRAQLSAIKCPIRGDVKYGARRSNKDRSIDLHAVSITIPKLELRLYAPPLGRSKLWEDLKENAVFHGDDTNISPS